jgi:hypothetical protein
LTLLVKLIRTQKGKKGKDREDTKPLIGHYLPYY